MLGAFTFSNAEQAPLIKRVDVDKESLESVAKSWVDANEAKWHPWVDEASK
jgi:ABC-type proline/glycine betaine transport system substrate-binding protein